MDLSKYRNITILGPFEQVNQEIIEKSDLVLKKQVQFRPHGSKPDELNFMIIKDRYRNEKRFITLSWDKYAKILLNSV